MPKKAMPTNNDLSEAEKDQRLKSRLKDSPELDELEQEGTILSGLPGR